MKRFIVYVIMAIGLCNLALAQKSLKPYSPFDEPKPRIPQEIMTDKRLDQHVKVFCKSRNLKDLIADISAKTGVRLTTNRDVSDWRVIIFFHDRPLRDVMTEIGNILHLHWLVSGKEGSYSYEIYEDGAQKQRQIRAQQVLDSFKAGVLDDFTNKTAFAPDGPQYSVGSAYMASPEDRRLVDTVRQFGQAQVESAFQGQNPILSYSQMPESLQQAFCDQINQLIHQSSDEYKTANRDVPPDRSPGDLGSARFTLSLMTKGGSGEDLAMPRFYIQIEDPSLFTGSRVVFPPWSVSTDNMLDAAGHPVSEEVAGDDSLSKNKKITIDKLRWLPNGRGLLLGDVLEGLAEQSGKDVIADYYLQDTSIGAIKDETEKQVVDSTAASFTYSCQASDSAISFKYNMWFRVDPLDEPPAKMLDTWWSAVEQNGQLTIGDILSTTSLRASQVAWPGLKLIPGGELAAQYSDIFRLWGSLSADQVSLAGKSEGLPGNQLYPEQAARMADILAARNLPAGEQDILGSKVSIFGADKASPLFNIELGGKLVVNQPLLLPATLSETERKEIIAQRMADAEAEKVEIVN